MDKYYLWQHTVYSFAPKNSFVSDEINQARSITANGPEHHMPNGFTGLSFCMGKPRPKDINVVDVEVIYRIWRNRQR
jgi:hypothetical protein